MQDRDARSESSRAKRRRRFGREEPISDVYAEIDNDLARDNLENDIPEPDQPR